MQNCFLAGCVWLVLPIICTDASALCSGGGFSGGSRSMGISGVVGSTSGGGGGGYHKPEKKFTKWELPAAVEPAKLDTTRFDALIPALNLSEEQLVKIEAAKKELRDTTDQLAKAQNEARSAYASAPGEVTCSLVARDVMQSAAAIKSFDPKQKFESALAIILNSDQRAKYRELVMKKM